MSLYQALSLIVFLSFFGGGAGWALYVSQKGLKEQQRRHRHKH